jgi:2-oxoisovalerate dehydrogenase E1 component
VERDDDGDAQPEQQRQVEEDGIEGSQHVGVCRQSSRVRLRQRSLSRAQVVVLASPTVSVRRESSIAARIQRLLEQHPGADPALAGPADEPIVPGSALTRRTAVALLECALQSRLQDLEARRLKDAGIGYYTIGSSGHEANAAFGWLLRTTDPAFLHYRSGAFMAARARQGEGETPIFDTMLAFVAAAGDPISGGRHKVFGSHALWVPPQTSTIASHLPKAVGAAFGRCRMDRLGLEAPIPADAVFYCSFGDASVNHATAQAGFNAAAAARLQRQPCPILFVCEDNGIGISVRTPPDYIERSFRTRPGLRYFAADGRDLAATYDQAQAAIAHCRFTQTPVFFHLKTVRLMGHAGTDVETSYRTQTEIEANEERDPLLVFMDLALRTGAIALDGLRALHRDLSLRIARAGAEAARRPKLASAEAIAAPLALPEPASLAVRTAPAEVRERVFKGQLPEADPRPRHMAFQLALGLRDLLAAYPQAFVFGEDVARKGGVYNVTAGLHETFRPGRVFNTILDETTILGFAQGMGLIGCLPVPEIQYLAYVHNALDQIRGEAASLKFFSGGRFRNPMVVRVAGYAYQKGFGGHFHNDNSIGALLDIPGLIVATPARADDAVAMLRTCMAAAAQAGSVCVFVEPIALYMTKDLHDKGDGQWLFPYPPPGEIAPLGEPRVYDASDDDQLAIVSYGNGLHMSLQAARALREQGTRARVVDLRWLAPLPMGAIKQHARETGRVLVVDECRRTAGGPSAHILAEIAEDPDLAGVRVRRLGAADSYVPLGPAADLVLVQIADIVAAARTLAEVR